MVYLNNDHLFEHMSPESPGTIGKNIRRLGLASQVAEAIKSPNNSTFLWYQRHAMLCHGLL